MGVGGDHRLFQQRRGARSAGDVFPRVLSAAVVLGLLLPVGMAMAGNIVLDGSGLRRLGRGRAADEGSVDNGI